MILKHYNMYSVFIISVLFVAAAVADPIKYQDCGSTAKIASVDVSNCTSEPCPFKHKTNETIKITFTPAEDSKGAKNKLTGIIAGVPVPFPVADDCCANKNLDCPIKSGNPTPYNLAVYVSPSYPKIRVLVKLEIQDDNGKDLVCIVLPAVIQD